MQRCAFHQGNILQKRSKDCKLFVLVFRQNRVDTFCGGNGGKGGDGAAGGGGAGGLSTPVLFKGGKPTLTQTTANPGALGSGGAGGASPTNDGQSGEAKAEHEVK